MEDTGVDPAALSARLASSIVAPLVKRLLVQEGAGAGLVDKPVRISRYVTFRGEKRTLTDKDLQKLAATLVRRAIDAAGPSERLIPADEEEAVALAVARTLYALGDLDMDNATAVRFGHKRLASELCRAAGYPNRGLSLDAGVLHDFLVETACLHVLDFFTRRSTFMPRALLTQGQQITELGSKIDRVLNGLPQSSDEDTAFQDRYAAYVSRKYGHLEIYGIDLRNSPRSWPLDVAYLSLETTPGAEWEQKTIRAEQILKGCDRALLRGVAGSGKTTLVQWLAVTAARQLTENQAVRLIGDVPFVLPLRTFKHGGSELPAPEEFLHAVRCPIAGAQPAGWADRVLSKGRGIVLVDGIDEIQERDREEAHRWLRELIENFPKNKWLVTSRPSAVRENWLSVEGFSEFTLSSMSPDDVEAFIRRWHQATNGDDVDSYQRSLLAAVRTKKDLGRLTANPLMCGLVCALHRDRRGYLPHDRIELYDAALSMLLYRRDRERAISQGDIEISETQQTQLLQKLAYWMIKNGSSEMERSDSVDLLSRVLPAMPAVANQGRPEQVLRHLLLRSGLLREPTVGTVDFIHRTFQDYLGSKAAVEECDFKFLIANAHQDQWEDVVRMAVSHARPAERARLLGGLIERGDNELDHRARLHLLAMACLEHATELSPVIREQITARTDKILPPKDIEQARALASVGSMVLELLPGPGGLSPEEARSVVLTAAILGDDAAIPLLSEYSKHFSVTVREELVSSWSKFDCKRYGEEVLAHVDEKDLYFSAISSSQLEVLKTLGGRARVELIGDFGSAEIGELGADRLTHLRIRGNSRIQTLDSLQNFPMLHHLTLSGCAELSSLSSIAGLSLRHLTFSGLDKIGNLEALGELSSLEYLYVGSPSYLPRGLMNLPQGAPLRDLHLPGVPLPRGWLREIYRWPDLQYLTLGLHNSPQTVAEWEDIGSLGNLRSLATAGYSLAHLPESFSMPGVTQVLLTYRLASTLSLSKLRNHFPDLSNLYIGGRHASGGVVDLSPLADLPNLSHVGLRGIGKVVGVEKLPERVDMSVYGSAWLDQSHLYVDR